LYREIVARKNFDNQPVNAFQPDMCYWNSEAVIINQLGKNIFSALQFFTNFCDQFVTQNLNILKRVTKENCPINRSTHYRHNCAKKVSDLCNDFHINLSTVRMGSGDFRALVAEHTNKLFRMACWMLHDQSEAEDVVQEVFLKIWEKQTDHNHYSNLEAYLIEMTKNKCLNRIKSRKKLVNEDQLRYMKSPQTSADYDVETNDELKRIKDVIAQLPENQRVVLQLKGVEGLEIREISKLLNETDNNVRVILSRARQAVRETYLKIYGYEPS